MIENLVGIQIDDEETYAEYRRRLAPVLEAHGAELLFDLRVAEVLEARGNQTFNRLFLMRFPSLEAAKKFSQSEEYVSLRDTYFTPSVSNTVFWGRYEVSPDA
ncbi:MAG: DUF1330 domain-containing protein [Myxococcota bacterium]